MNHRQVRARVPGKIMLAGEYAVLQGGACLACTVDQWLEVRVAAGHGEIRSAFWPEVLTWDTIASERRTSEPLLQVLAASSLPINELSIEVISDLDPSHGLGSSTAVRLAALMALQAYSGQQTEGSLPLAQAREVWRLQRQQQTFASGYDALTQAVGGLLAWTPDYKVWPGHYENLNRASAQLQRWIHVWVGGRGAPTQAVGDSVRTWLAKNHMEAALTKLSGNLVSAFTALLTGGATSELEAVCAASRAHRSLFIEAPAYPRHLLESLASLPGFDSQWSFKTTGAGGEDAVLLIGEKMHLGPAFQALSSHGWRPLAVAFGEAGAYVVREGIQ